MTDKILIVDDEKDLTQELGTWLSEHNYDVITANDGIEGFVKAKSHRPDLIIMDVLMPGMSGYQVIEELNRLEEYSDDIPIIIMSARPSMKKFFEEGGSRSFISKPFDSETLLKKIKTLLKDRSDARQSAGPKSGHDIQKVHLIGVESYVVDKLKDFLTASGMAVVFSETEEDALRKLEKDCPDAVIGQYWESGQNFNLLRIYEETQKNVETKNLLYIVFCIESLGLEAKLSMPSAYVIPYRESADLIQKLKKYFTV